MSVIISTRPVNGLARPPSAPRPPEWLTWLADILAWRG